MEDMPSGVPLHVPIRAALAGKRPILRLFRRRGDSIYFVRAAAARGVDDDRTADPLVLAILAGTVQSRQNLLTVGHLAPPQT